MLNINTEDDNHQVSLPPSHLYFPPQHMTNLSLNDDETSFDIFYNLNMQLHDGLNVGDEFHTKEDCVRAIKKFHMENSTNYIVDCTDTRMYVIIYCNKLCMFQQVMSYRKRSYSWEISSMDLPPSCTTINIIHVRRCG